MAAERERGEDSFQLASVIDPKERDRVRARRTQIEQVVMNEISPSVEIVFCIVIQVPLEDRVQPVRDRLFRRRIGLRDLFGEPHFILDGFFPAPSFASDLKTKSGPNFSTEFFD